MSDKCERCLLQRSVCLCASIPTVPTRTRVVIVRHTTERLRSSNTGRLAHLALPNSVIVDHGGLDGPAKLPPLEGAWLVYPEGEPTAVVADPPAQIVVLDATWSQARRMFRKLGALRGLPLLRLAPSVDQRVRLREAPTPDRVSTIEAIAGALRLVEGDTVADPLEALFRVAIERAGKLGRNM